MRGLVEIVGTDLVPGCRRAVHNKIRSNLTSVEHSDLSIKNCGKSTANKFSTTVKPLKSDHVEDF
jgi:hypothetical protein